MVATVPAAVHVVAVGASNHSLLRGVTSVAPLFDFLYNLHYVCFSACS